MVKISLVWRKRGKKFVARHGELRFTIEQWHSGPTLFIDFTSGKYDPLYERSFIYPHKTTEQAKTIAEKFLEKLRGAVL